MIGFRDFFEEAAAQTRPQVLHCLHPSLQAGQTCTWCGGGIRIIRILQRQVALVELVQGFLALVHALGPGMRDHQFLEAEHVSRV